MRFDVFHLHELVASLVWAAHPERIQHVLHRSGEKDAAGYGLPVHGTGDQEGPFLEPDVVRRGGGGGGFHPLGFLRPPGVDALAAEVVFAFQRLRYERQANHVYYVKSEGNYFF